MKTESINSNINFQAKYIKSTHVKKFNPIKHKYLPKQVSFVEIDPENPKDIIAIGNTAKYWTNEMYASNIAYCAMHMHAKSPFFMNKKIYALTNQKNNFNELKDEEILGLTELTEESDKFVKLNYLQVNPDIIYNPQQPIKKIGSRILDTLKEIYNDQTILLTSRNGSTVHFYEKNGFTNIDPQNNKFQWRKK